MTSRRIHFKEWLATGRDKDGKRVRFRIVFPIPAGWDEAYREATEAGCVKLDELAPASNQVQPRRKVSFH